MGSACQACTENSWHHVVRLFITLPPHAGTPAHLPSNTCMIYKIGATNNGLFALLRGWLASDFFCSLGSDIRILHHNAWMENSPGGPSSNRTNGLKVGQINLLTWAGLPEPFQGRTVLRWDLYRVTQLACQWVSGCCGDRTWQRRTKERTVGHDWVQIMIQIRTKNLDHKCAVTIKQILRNGGVILMIYTAGFVP